MQKIHFFLLLCFSFHSSFSQDLLSQNKAERYYKTGIELLGRNEFGAARKSFEDFLNIHTLHDQRHTEAEYYQSLCALNLYHADGEKLLEQFIENNPADPHAATAWYDLGNFFYTERNYTRASTYYGKVDYSALSAEQRNIGKFRWGYSLFTQKKLKEALDQFNAIKNQGGQYGPAAGYYAGYVEYTLGDYANALNDLKRAEQSPSYAKIVPYMIANAYYKQKDYTELLAYASKFKGNKDISNSDEIALLTAEASFRKADYKGALAGYQQYFDKKDNADRGVMARAGYSAFLTGQDALALGYFRSAASDQDSVGYYSSYYLGILYLKQQQKPLALTAFDNARKFKGDPVLAEESAWQYAKISFDLGQSDQGIAESERFLKTYPGSQHATELRELLSQAYTNANNYNKAIEYIESLPQRSPAIDRAYQKATYLKGTELFNKTDYAQAVQYFEKSLKKRVDKNYTAEAGMWTGEAYSIGKKYAEAVPYYEIAINLGNDIYPDIQARSRYGVAYALYNQQEYNKALYYFIEFTSLNTKGNPNYPDAIIRIADCYYVGKDIPAALENYQKAIQLNSGDKDYALLQQGVILGSQRKYAEAMGALDMVIKNFPASRYYEEALFQRGQFDFEQGNYDAAVGGFSKIIAANKPSKFLPYAFQRRAAAYYNLKEYSNAADDYSAIVIRFPTHPITQDVLLPLGEALNLANRSGEFSKYRTAYKTSNPDAKGIEAIEFEAAKNLYFNQDYGNALAELDSYISTYSDLAHLAEAKYYRAESLFRLKQYEKALAGYYELAPDNNFVFATKVTGRIGEIEFKQGHYDKAVTAFRKLASTTTSKKDLSTAWSGSMESWFILGRYDSSDAYARLILEKGKVNAGAENKASLYLGKSAMARGDMETAKDEFLSTLNNAHDEYGAEAKYSLAQLFFQNKEYKQCYETLVSLNNDFSSYSDWVGKSFLLIADYFVVTGDNFQARGTLKSLIDKFPLPEVRQQAVEKLKKLDDEDARKKAEIKSDTTDH